MNLKLLNDTSVWLDGDVRELQSTMLEISNPDGVRDVPALLRRLADVLERTDATLETLVYVCDYEHDVFRENINAFVSDYN